MKVLVTGATGFLGRFLTEKLKERGDEIVSLSSKECDLTKEGSLLPFSKTHFDHIYHLAVWTQAGDFCLYHPAEQWLINQKINTNLLQFWQQHQPQAKLITLGTSCAYDPQFPLSEEYYLHGRPIDSLVAYGMTKRMLLAGLEAFSSQYGLNYLYLIPSTLYGPYYHTKEKQLHFIFDLIRKILRGKHFGEEVVLWGDGEQKRELIYIRDFCNILLDLEKKTSNTIVNVGGGKEYSIKEFAKMICAIVDYPFEKITFDTSKYVGAKSKVLLIDRLNKLLPELNQTSIKEGLEKTVPWCEEHLASL